MQREVAPELKAAFARWIDERTQVGVQRYGEPLLTNNGRDARQDAFEELLDFTQYQQQRIMELEDKMASLVPDKIWLDKMRSEFKPALCGACKAPLQFSKYRSSEFWTGCDCGNHVPQCLGRDEDDEVDFSLPIRPLTDDDLLPICSDADCPDSQYHGNHDEGELDPAAEAAREAVEFGGISGWEGTTKAGF